MQGGLASSAVVKRPSVAGPEQTWNRRPFIWLDCKYVLLIPRARRGQMDQPNLPHHVVERVERRWAAVLSQQATRRPEGKLPGIKHPSPDRMRQTPEKGSAHSLSKRGPAWNGLF
jgi:hypothetical protein